MHEAQSVPVVPDASLYPHVSIFFIRVANEDRDNGITWFTSRIEVNPRWKWIQQARIVR